MKSKKSPYEPNVMSDFADGLNQVKRLLSQNHGAEALRRPKTMNSNSAPAASSLVGDPIQHPTTSRFCPSILLADVDAYTLALNARVLAWSGYKVQTVADGAEAWKALDHQNYDLLITENEMPEVTGMQLLKHLRSRGITMPVIMASGTAPTKELKLHPGLLLEAALCKPVSGDQLLQTVKLILQTADTTTCGGKPVSINERLIPRAKAPAAAPQPTRTNFPKTILFVDDEPLIRQLHKEILSDFGYAVELAEDGADAWDALQLHSYDLLITDNDMPKVTGVELLKKLHAARIALPAIMISGTMPTEELKRPELLAVEATLHKPYEIADLMHKVNSILGTPQTSRA